MSSSSNNRRLRSKSFSSQPEIRREGSPELTNSQHQSTNSNREGLQSSLRSLAPSKTTLRPSEQPQDRIKIEPPPCGFPVLPGQQLSSPTQHRALSQGSPKPILKKKTIDYYSFPSQSPSVYPRGHRLPFSSSQPSALRSKLYNSSQCALGSTPIKSEPQSNTESKLSVATNSQTAATMSGRAGAVSRAATDIYNLPGDESGAKQSGAPARGRGTYAKKTAPVRDDSSSSDEESSSSSDESESGESKVTSSALPPSAQPVAAKSQKKTASSDSDSSEDEESSDSDSESESEKANTKAAENEASSEEESSDEDSEPETNGNTQADSGALSTYTTNEPAPKVIGGVFKLQQPKSLGQIARVFESAEKEGNKLWVLTHSSSTPLNLEIQKVAPVRGQKANAIVSSNAKITVPRLKDGDSYHLISSCKSISIIQTTNGDVDASFETPPAPESAKSSKPAPTQPTGLRTRFVPIGVESRVTPQQGSSEAKSATEPEKTSKKEKKQKKAKEDKAASTSTAPASTPSSQLTERPKKKRKVASPPPVEAPAPSQVKSADEELAELKARIAMLENEKSGQPAEEAADSSKKSKKDKKEKKEKKDKSKAKTEAEESEEPPKETPKSKSKVKFAQNEAAATSSPARGSQTPIPPPVIPTSSQPESSQAKKTKRRRPTGAEEGTESKKKRSKSVSESPAPSSRRQVTPIQPPQLPHVKRVTPIQPPAIPGMP